MAEDPESAERLRAASDPTTPQASLADLAYDYPEVRVAVAANRSTYAGLLEWLRDLKDADIDAAIAARSDAPTPVTEASNPVGAEFAPVAPSPGVTCERCGAALGRAVAFCGDCGTKVPGRVAANLGVMGVIGAFRRKPVVAFAALTAAVVFVALGAGIAAAAGLTSAQQAAQEQANSASGDDGSGSGADSGGASGFNTTRVADEPAILPACPQGQTPVSFTTWSNGNGATLVCQGSGDSLTVVFISDGKTHTTANGSVTPTGYHADFGSGLSIDIGFGGWAAWVRDGGTTTLQAATTGWHVGDSGAKSFPKLSGHVQPCPAGTYPLSLSTWHGGWLLTCGETASAITRFAYANGSAHGSGHGMTEQGGQSCGTDSAGLRVCVSASPAVVTFSSKGGAQTQHSVDANYAAGEGFGGAGQGTGTGPGASAEPGAILATLQVHTDPQDVAISPDGHTAYVTTLEGMTIEVIDLSSLSVARSIPLGAQAGAVKLTSSGQLLVAEAQDNAVAVVDPKSGHISARIPVGSDPIALALVPHTNEFMTSNFGSGDVTLANTKTGKSREITVGAQPWGVAVSPDGKDAYVAIQSANSVADIDLVKGKIKRTIGVGARPAYLVVSPDGRALYVAEASQGSVSTVSLNTGTVTSRAAIGGKPWGIDVSPSGKFVYVCDNSGNQLVILDVETGQTVSATAIETNPDFVGATLTGNLIVVPDGTANTVSILAGAEPGS